MSQATQAHVSHKDLKLNRLSYNILGVIVREPKSGYEIVAALEKFRPVNISQIYPLLAKMEEVGLLTTETIEQTGKPDKKVCHPTPFAYEVLQDWIADATEEPVLRDDFLSKVYGFWASDREQQRVLIEERLSWLDDEIAYFKPQLEDLHSEHPGEVDDPDQWFFCRDILIRRRLTIYREERLWCLRVLSRLENATDSEEDRT